MNLFQHPSRLSENAHPVILNLIQNLDASFQSHAVFPYENGEPLNDQPVSLALTNLLPPDTVSQKPRSRSKFGKTALSVILA